MNRTRTRTDVINSLIAGLGYSRYLEIGCQSDVNFDAVDATRKVGVDPSSGGTVRMTSDEYFASAMETFDLVFIDGDHHHSQVKRDVDNALRRLAPDGTIVMHDCLPLDAHYESPNFCGTAWRAFLYTRERTDLDSFVCDFDHGVGVVRRGANPSLVKSGKTLDALTYDDLVQNKQAWMRPTTFEELLRHIAAWH